MLCESADQEPGDQASESRRESRRWSTLEQPAMSIIEDFDEEDEEDEVITKLVQNETTKQGAHKVHTRCLCGSGPVTHTALDQCFPTFSMKRNPLQQF